MEKQFVKINRKALSKEKEVNLNLDFIVPDAKPDIIAIIDTNANSYIYNEELGNGKIRLDGNVDSKVLYLSESGETRSLSVTLDFSEVIEDNIISSNLTYYSFVELLNIDTKIINERKINVSAKIKIYVSFYEATEIKLISSLDDFENLEIKEEKCNIKNLIGTGKSKSSIKEVYECDSMDSILDILKVDINISNTENKVSFNKVLSKSDCEIKIVYQTEDMNIKVAKTVYPIMSFIDLENVSEEHILETNTNLKNMQVFVLQNESNKFSLNLEFETSLQVFSSKEISIIDDVYSLNKIIEFSKKEIEAELVSEKIDNKISLFEEVIVEDISKIVDIKSCIRIVGKERVGGYVNYNIQVNLKIMYELDSRNGLAVKNTSFNTIARIEENLNDETIFSILKEDYNLNKDKITCNIEIIGSLQKNGLKKISVLDDIEEKGDETKSEYSMAIYFVKPKDTIWKIAKSFKVSMQSIIDANNIENPDRINVGDRLYIVR